jgi:hypothetical protein
MKRRVWDNVERMMKFSFVVKLLHSEEIITPCRLVNCL